MPSVFSENKSEELALQGSGAGPIYGTCRCGDAAISRDIPELPIAQLSGGFDLAGTVRWQGGVEGDIISLKEN